MKSVLAGFAAIVVVALMPAAEGRADTRLPRDAELDGLSPVERDIIREIDEIEIFVPDMDEKLTDRLSEAETFEERRDVLDDVLEEFDEKFEGNPFVNPDSLERVRARVKWLLDVLRIVYYHPNAYMGTNEVFGDLPPGEQRRAGDMSSLDPAEKRVLGIPLTEDEKASSGLDDLTPAELEEKGIPPRPRQAPAPDEEGEDRRTSQADSYQRPSFGLAAKYGSLDRGKVSFLRTELGGVVIDANFGEVERDDEFKAIEGSFTYPIGTHRLGAKPFDLRLFGAGTYGFGDVDEGGDLLSADGNQMAILGPEGPGGPLGGGLVTAAGFGDVTDWGYSDDYEEGVFRLGVEAQSSYADPPIRLRPRFSLFYGFTDEDSRFSGMTNADTIFFEYDNKLESDRYGAELGLHADVPVTAGFSIYADGGARLTYDDAEGETRLEADQLGVPFPSEKESYSDSGWHFGGTLGAGIAYERGPLRGSLGAEFESWKVPVTRVTGTEPATLDFESRNSWAVKLEIRLSF